MDELIIETTATSKRNVSLCRTNPDGTLSIIGSANMTVTTDFANSTETAKYKNKVYAVKGTIYLSYILVD
jgi:hypothetical protein